jgi:hypothetical protein
MLPEPQQFTVSLFCSKCGAKGSVTWERENGQRVLVKVCDSFYERLRKKAPYPIELVCVKCGTAQLE